MFNFGDNFFEEEFMKLLLASKIAYLRAINTSPDQDVNIYVNGMLFAQNVRYLGYTPYRPVAPGRYDIAIFPARGAIRPIRTETVVIKAQTFVTFAVYGLKAQLRARTIIDSAMGAPKGKSSVKVAHFSPGAPAVDVFADNKRIFKDVKYGEVTGYDTLAPARYSFQIKKADTSQTVYTLPNQRLEEDKTYTGYITGIVNSKPALKLTFILDGKSALREQNRIRNLER